MTADWAIAASRTAQAGRSRNVRGAGAGACISGAFATIGAEAYPAARLPAFGLPRSESIGGKDELRPALGRSAIIRKRAWIGPWYGAWQQTPTQSAAGAFGSASEGGDLTKPCCEPRQRDPAPAQRPGR